MKPSSDYWRFQIYVTEWASVGPRILSKGRIQSEERGQRGIWAFKIFSLNHEVEYSFQHTKNKIAKKISKLPQQSSVQALF